MSAIVNGPKNGSRKPNDERTTSSTCSGVARPSSTILAASLNIANWIRLATNPGPSPTTTAALPSRVERLDDLLARPARPSTAAGSPRRTGRAAAARTSACRGSGPAVCSPAASSAIGIDDVFVAITAPSRGGRLDRRVDGEPSRRGARRRPRRSGRRRRTPSSTDAAAVTFARAVAVAPSPTLPAASSRESSSSDALARRLGQLRPCCRRARSGCRSRRRRARCRRPSSRRRRSRRATARRSRPLTATPSAAPRARPRRPPSASRRAAGAGRARRGRSPSRSSSPYPISRSRVGAPTSSSRRSSEAARSSPPSSSRAAVAHRSGSASAMKRNTAGAVTATANPCGTSAAPP